MKKTYIIAEIGCNHNGDEKLAYELVDRAVESGVDAVKFQTFKADKLISKVAPKAEYQVKNTGDADSQLEMTKKLELSYETYLELFKYTAAKGVDWFSTPFDFDSIEFLEQLDMKIWKIPSGEVTNLPYLEKIGSLPGNIIISTGMANIAEVKQALEILENQGKKREEITILHCITEYPTPDNEMHISTVKYLIDNFPDYTIGLSDHSSGYEAAIGSVALGAEVVEKHFTLDNDMPGPDHKASANPEVLDALVEGVRKIEVMMGTPKLEATDIEKKNIPVARKSIVAAADIKAGDVLTEENITVKRPGNGISPMKWYDVLGTVAKKDYAEDELID